MKPTLLLSLGLALAFCGSAFAQSAPASPAEMISNFRHQHGEGGVTLDPALNRVAQAQASAMAAKDALEHDVLGSFNSRVAGVGSERAAENIAYGYDNFPKTLEQWINSSGHRKNLLMHNASRVGVAHAVSSTTHRTYWAMVIAEYPRPAPAAKGKARAQSQPQAHAHALGPQTCHLRILGLCM